MGKLDNQKESMESIATRRIDTLFSLARKEVEEKGKYAVRYVTLAKKIAARHRIPLGKERKRLFCKECLMPLVLGKNATVRLRAKDKIAEYKCECGAVRKFPYGRKRIAAPKGGQ